MLGVFIGLAAGAFLGLAILLVIGLDHEIHVGHEIDVSHEVGTGHEVGAGHEVSHEIGDLGQASPGVLSVRLLLFFVLGFGVFGIIAMEVVRWRGPVAILIAVAGAFICYFTAYKILKALWKQQVSTQFSVNSLVGTEAVVAQRIPPGGIGEIKGKCPQTGLENYVRAKSLHPGQSIEKGEIVTVKSVVSSVCTVEKKKENSI